MLDRVKENKKNVAIFNLSIIALSWFLFFLIINLAGKSFDIFLKNIFHESFVSSLFFLVGIPSSFSFLLIFLVVSRNKDDKKKWIIKGVVVPLVIWSFFIAAAVLFYYFFGWNGY